MKKVLAIVLALISLSVCSISAIAAEKNEGYLQSKITEPRYADATRISPEFYKSGGNAKAKIVISLNGSVNTSVKITIEKKVGESWQTVDSFSDSSQGSYFTLEGSVPCSSGQTYRAVFSGSAGRDRISTTKTLNA